MRTSAKRVIVSSLIFIFVLASTAFLSILLGNAYLGILESVEVKPNVKKQPQQNLKQSTAVTAEKQLKTIEVTPISVFFLQGGVYSQLDSARKAAEDFLNIGLEPFITDQVPYRLYIGFFVNREEAINLKNYISEKELSTFIQSQVLNSEVLTYDAANSNKVEPWIPFLEEYSEWIRGLGSLQGFGAFDQVDKGQIIETLPKVSDDLSNINLRLTQLQAQKGGENKPLNQLLETAVILEQHMKELQKDWTQHNYNRVSKDLITFVNAYTQCWEKLGVVDKT